VTVSGGNLSGISFTDQAAASSIAIDANASMDRTTAGTSIASPEFSTASGNELLLAFIAADSASGTNVTVSNVSGGGLTWAIVVRTNSQKGSAEIWRAFATAPMTNATVTATLSQSVVSSITVMSFTGADGSGSNGSGAIGATGTANAASGAPAASLVTTRNNSWVFGVGNDWDNAMARTPGAGQSLIHQDLASIGDTYWVQMQGSPTSLSGTNVTISDTAPIDDRYNLSICEILAAQTVGQQTWNISGTISPSSGGSSATVTLSGAGSAATTADASGNYTFAGLPNGSYTVTPSKSGYTFTPPSQLVTVNGASLTGISFTAQAVQTTWSISGTISPSLGGSGATVSLSGAVSASTIASALASLPLSNRL